MPITRTNSKRYVATCVVADCDWSDGPHRHRVVVSERLRYHVKTQHGLNYTDPDRRDTHPMKQQTETELPPQETGPQLKDYVGQLVVFGMGWVTDKIRTKNGPADVIKADLYVYNPDTKAWDNPGTTTVFWAVVKRRLHDAGNEDDLGGVLVQGTDRNPREWDLVPPNAAQSKLLDKFAPADREPF